MLDTPLSAGAAAESAGLGATVGSPSQAPGKRKYKSKDFMIISFWPFEGLMMLTQ